MNTAANDTATERPVGTPLVVQRYTEVQPVCPFIWPTAMPYPTAVGPVAYDTAIVGRLHDSAGRPAFPTAIEWLLRHQHADGTWGAAIWHAHDRLVSTLAAILCLHEAHTGDAAITRAVAALPGIINRLAADDHETIGFEIIAPSLLDQCAEAGFPVPSGILSDERQRRAQRLAHGHKSTAGFSMEGIDTIPAEALALLSPRGSFMASPSATAALLRQHPGAPVAWEYLRWLAAHNGGGIPAVHPLESFAYSWSCFYLDISGAGSSILAQRLRELAAGCWGPAGASYSNDCPIPNGDDSSLNYLVQCRGGRALDPAVFAPYITPDGARCHIGEYDASVGANANILLALRGSATTPQVDDWCASLLTALRRATYLRHDGLLSDKWHSSPIYPTAHALLATHGLARDLTERLVAALLSAQHRDGAWGYERGTAEETAYALIALFITAPHRYRAEIRAGLSALMALHTFHPVHLGLWIGKSLYCPRPVVDNAIHAAYRLARQHGF